MRLEGRSKSGGCPFSKHCYAKGSIQIAQPENTRCRCGPVPVCVRSGRPFILSPPSDAAADLQNRSWIISGKAINSGTKRFSVPARTKRPVCRRAGFSSPKPSITWQTGLTRSTLELLFKATSSSWASDKSDAAITIRSDCS